ncbi:MAG: serine hydrolase [Bacteroidetes bacterium]|nr:serine hydrolase [Bacteroidota bacterium]
MKRIFIYVSFFLFCVNNFSFSQKNNPAVFEQYIKQAMQLWKTPGLSIVVIKDDNVVYKNAFGVTQLGKPDPFTTSTLSICASTTKAMTAVCMGMLVDEGKVKWTDKVSDVYPALKLYDDYATSEITVKDLFTHNTGLGNADLLWVLGFPLDTIIYRMRFIKPAYSFRSSFIYQNLMYMVAGEVIHKISGKTWDEFIKERLFSPLGMDHTYPVYAQSVNEPSHISPHWMYDDSVVKPIPFIDTKGIDAAGGVWSCANDIAKWVKFILDSASINGKRLLTAGTFEELFKPQSIVTDEEFYPTQQVTKPHWKTYGLGWFQEDYRGKMVQFHTGSLDGAVAIIGLIPDQHFGVYIFANMDHTELRHALMYKAMDLWCFNDNANDWSKDLYKLYVGLKKKSKDRGKEEEAKRVMNTKPSLPLSSYAGEYTNEIFGDAQVVFANDSLRLKFPKENNLRLSHWNYDTFLGKYDYDWNDKTTVRFSLDNEGKVSQFEIDGLVYTKK